MKVHCVKDRGLSIILLLLANMGYHLFFWLFLDWFSADRIRRAQKGELLVCWSVYILTNDDSFAKFSFRR